MNTLILVGFYLAAFHIIYETILLPSFRQALRFRLFAIRDRLRNLKADRDHQLDSEVFRYVDESLTWQMNNQKRLTLALLFNLPRFAKEARTDVENRLQLMARCQLPEFIQIRKDAGKLLMLAFSANAGAWFIYVVPFAITVACYDALKETLKKFIVIPSRDLNKLAPVIEA